MELPEIAVIRPVTTIMVFVAAIALLGCISFFKLNLGCMDSMSKDSYTTSQRLAYAENHNE